KGGWSGRKPSCVCPLWIAGPNCVSHIAPSITHAIPAAQNRVSSPMNTHAPPPSSVIATAHARYSGQLPSPKNDGQIAIGATPPAGASGCAAPFSENASIIRPWTFTLSGKSAPVYALPSDTWRGPIAPLGPLAPAGALSGGVAAGGAPVVPVVPV